MDAILHRRPPSLWEQFRAAPLLFVAERLYAWQMSSSKAHEMPAPKDPKVRVVCISDTHNVHDSLPPLPDGDILIHAGDLTQSGTIEELHDVLQWLQSQPHPHKIFIAGNHDRALGDSEARTALLASYPGLIYLEDSSADLTIRGRTLHVYGSPYTPQYGNFVFQYPRISSTRARASAQWACVPAHTDILVTHGPPAHHLDNRAGCPALLAALWRVRPRLHVFGHIHVARGVEVVAWGRAQGAYERIVAGLGGWWDLWSLVRGCFDFASKRQQDCLIAAVSFLTNARQAGARCLRTATLCETCSPGRPVMMQTEVALGHHDPSRVFQPCISSFLSDWPCAVFATPDVRADYDLNEMLSF
ncbi:hypothetical protein PLICRDRAFT_127040 [Plicaturopsis crispa FD-325 SS-3]|uniref:Calcineurin-like phosphoesterase domain-containing protein n=1 Tax=Plicaturopsis crispa FD-325 SS-3 TaxID=944288 RepID=A0A0C9SQW6_PLICR|nr:hypothetical protein PLICRDRAFT_127040 [Plicaturopsis crispa FD-325 SS-3]